MSENLVATTPSCVNCGDLTPMAFVYKGNARFLCVHCHASVKDILNMLSVDFQYVNVSW